MNPSEPASPLSPEEQLAIMREQLHQLQKLTALGELVSITTHEFNNVLMTIINYAKMGMRHRDQATRDKALEKILAAGNRAARITNGILGFARNRSAGQEPTDMIKLIDDTLLLVEREMVKYRIRVEKQLPPTPPAFVNSNQIQQVLLNLLINARQAMTGGGQVLLKLHYDDANHMIELTVRDTGSGIPSDKMPRIFDRFYTTKSGPDATGKGGTGLGLSFCRDVIEAHHGRIRVESSLGKGTAFTLKLPACPRSETSGAPALGAGTVDAPATQIPAAESGLSADSSVAPLLAPPLISPVTPLSDAAADAV